MIVFVNVLVDTTLVGLIERLALFKLRVFRLQL